MGYSNLFNSLKTGWKGFKLVAEVITGVALVIGFSLFLDSQGVIQIPWIQRATVPDVIAMPISEARALLEESELTANVICEDPQDSEVDPGSVHKMDPRPEARVDRWSTVTVLVKPPCA